MCFKGKALLNYRSKIQAFIGNSQGSTSIVVAAFITLLAGASSYGVHFAMLVSEKQHLQDVADQTAIITAKQMQFQSNGSPDNDTTTLRSIAQSVAEKLHQGDDLQSVLSIISDDTLRVKLSVKAETPFSSFFPETDLEAAASAQVYGSQSICVIAMTDSGPGIHLDDDASIDGGECALYSNSNGRASIKLSGTSEIDAALTCAVGGIRELGGRVLGEALTDCPELADPIEARGINFDDKDDCLDYLDFDNDNNAGTLLPGNYCEGMNITDRSVVTLSPGTYYFGDDVTVSSNATLLGEYVTIIMSDHDSNLVFKDDANVQLTAQKEGEMAGILIAFNPNHDARAFKITSPQVETLLGTIYMPNDKLVIDTDMSISEKAAFTIVVANQIVGNQSPKLVLNTDYAATDVPVPNGFKEKSNVRLVE